MGAAIGCGHICIISTFPVLGGYEFNVGPKTGPN
jgi:hypothetical protein